MQALYDGNNVTIMGDNVITIKPTLDTGIYKIVTAPMRPPVLQRQRDFSVPEHTFGKNKFYAEYIFRQFKKTEGKNLGCLFVGPKGVGKSLLAKTLCVMGLKENIPVLFIDSTVSTDVIKSLLEKMPDKAIVFFDEFEKNYKNKRSDEGISQYDLLGALDGGLIINKMFIFTANEEFAISDYFVNRPGRIRYYIKFTGLLEDEIAEYCDMCLTNPQKKGQIIRMARAIPNFSYDQLISIVEEVNDNADMNVEDILDMFNLKSQNSDLELEIEDIYFDEDVALNISIQELKENLRVNSRSGYISIISSKEVFKTTKTDDDGDKTKKIYADLYDSNVEQYLPNGGILFYHPQL